MSTLQTWAPLNVNEVYTAASITNSENDILIKAAPLNVGQQTPGRPEPIIQIRSDVAWVYRYVAGGAGFPVAAGELFNYRVTDAHNGNRIYVLTATGTGTLYGMRII